MFYKSELNFLKEAFAKCRLRTFLLPCADIPEKVSFSEIAEKLNSSEAEHIFLLREHLVKAQPNTIYKLSDPFGCYYLFLLLPKQKNETILVIGPYLTAEQTSEAFLERAERLGLAPRAASLLKNYYADIPLISDTAPIFAILDTFAEHIWGGIDNFSVVDIDIENSASPSPLSVLEHHSIESTERNRMLMEQRYAYENELMQAVSHGLVHKAELLLSGFSQFSFEQRLTDPVRNLKNYCIIMNTLLRKAAENGGVHPLYLDSVSSDFAKKIEQISSAAEVSKLMSEMFQSYCRLVRKHSMCNFSPLVQRTIIHIDTDLSADLSLSTLAQAQKVSSSYLSALFHHETGQTLTDHVNQKRVKLAMQLLKTTSLQIQTIAQHCGILDVHYFSRIFKKYAGKTPKEYRES